MTKYSTELKIKVVKAYLNNEGGYTLLAEYVGNDNSGLLLYLNTNTRDYYFTLSGKVLRMIDDKRQKSLDDNLLLNLKAGDYNKAFMSFFDEAARYIKGGEIQGNVLVNEQRLTAKDFKIAGIGGLTTFLISFFGLKKSSTPRPSKFVYYLIDNSNLGYAISGDSCIKTFKTSRVIPKFLQIPQEAQLPRPIRDQAGGPFLEEEENSKIRKYLLGLYFRQVFFYLII